MTTAFITALQNLLPGVNIAVEGDYIRVEDCAPECTNETTPLYTALAGQHGAHFDGYDEEGFPCFFATKPTWV